MDLRRLRLQEWLTGACGVALLVALFLDWYAAGSAKADAWESFSVLDVLLALVGLMAVGLAVAAGLSRAQAVPVGIGSMLVLVGLVVSVWLAIRVASPPDGADREAGAWIGLVACIGATLSALWSIRDDRFPSAVTDAARVDIPTLPAPPRGGASP
ncbi:MAG: hypothetical protein QOH38_1819 [Thermoleophilaceae bacterium]|nr:hypothetical protein [Thermoleophilaceae bacterium]MEA2369101.1 hypothetical protein [Thermoleophilaceae bacterium]